MLPFHRPTAGSPAWVIQAIVPKPEDEDDSPHLLHARDNLKDFRLAHMLEGDGGGGRMRSRGGAKVTPLPADGAGADGAGSDGGPVDGRGESGAAAGGGGGQRGAIKSPASL